MRLISTLFFLVFFLMSCKTQSLKNGADLNFILDSIAVKNDKYFDESFNFRFSSYIKNSENPVLIYDDYHKGIILHDVNKNTAHYVAAKLDSTFLIKSPNFCFSNFNGEIYLFTVEGKVFQLCNEKFNLIDDFLRPETLSKIGLLANTTFGLNREPVFLNDSTIIFPNFIDYDSPNYNKKFDKSNKFPSYTIYDFKQKKAKLLDYNIRPDFFKGHKPLRNLFWHISKNDTLIIHYMYSEVVDLYSVSKNEQIGSLSLKSSYQTNPIRILRNNKNQFENDRYSVEQGYYGSLVYNPFKKCYYRIFYHELPRKNENDEYTIYTDKISSIAVFNENFVWIDEFKFPTGYYIFLGITPTKEGLILNSHYNIYKDKTYMKYLKHD